VGEPMRSMHLIASDARRGAETFAVDLVAELAGHGHEGTVVALTPSESQEVHEVPILGRSRRAPTVFRELRAAAAEADVIVAHGSSTLEACAVALFGTGVPFIYRTIGDPSYWVTSFARRRVIGAFLRRATRHVALWDGAANQLASRYSIPRSRIDVISNAVPAEKYPRATPQARAAARVRLGIAPNTPCLVFVGALSAEKDVRTLIGAVRELDDVVLLVAGDGPERASLEELSVATCHARVRYLGSVREPYELYAAADLLVLPSRSEGMPGVVIEAGLVGTASVSTPVGSVPEMLEHGVTGFLTTVGDPGALVETIRLALPDAHQVGRCASESFGQKYVLDSVISSWTTTLEAAVRR
jgi:glycosyltransferase involved in cell wall biosynthesis